MKYYLYNARHYTTKEFDTAEERDVAYKSECVGFEYAHTYKRDGDGDYFY